MIANGAESGVGISNSSMYLGGAKLAEGVGFSRARNTQQIRIEVRRTVWNAMLESPHATEDE